MGAFLTHLTTICIHGVYTQVETPKRLGSYLVIGDWGWDANVHGFLAHQAGGICGGWTINLNSQPLVDGSEIPIPTNHRWDGAKTL